MTDRFTRIQAALADADLAALALVPGANLRYVLGLSMHLNERLTVAFCTADGEVHMVLPALEAPRAAAEALVPIEFYPWTDAEGYGEALGRCLDTMELDGLLGVEYTTMRVLELRAIEEESGVVAVNAEPLLAKLRMVKDDAEIAAMRRAVTAVEAGLATAIAAIKPGITERAIKDVWERAMTAAGSAEPAFETIVASGPNSANPHHTTGDRAIASGDLVILDGGAVVDGYRSDITRTVAVGPLSAEQQRIYDAVLAANRAGVAAAAPGASGAAIDAAARGVIAAAGYGPQFVHRTGHGLGLETHEPPYINSPDTQPLAAGTTFTVEPGVYVAGQGGVRIEDDVLLTDAGSECLTTFRRELIQL